MGNMPIDELISAARREMPPDALMARILEQGCALQGQAPVPPVPLPPVPVPPVPVLPVRALRGRAGAVATLAAALGGWRGASGLSAAMLAGVLIGFADPGGLLTRSAGGDLVELLPGATDPWEVAQDE